MTIIPFPTKPRVEILGSVLQSSTIIDEHGSRPDFSEVGCYKFFVDTIDADGRIGMWDGHSYDEAILRAHELSADGFGHVVDLVVGGAA